MGKPVPEGKLQGPRGRVRDVPSVRHGQGSTAQASEGGALACGSWAAPSRNGETGNPASFRIRRRSRPRFAMESSWPAVADGAICVKHSRPGPITSRSR